MSMGQETAEQRPVGALLASLVSQVDALFRTEIRLLRSELNENVGAIKGGLVAVMVGAVLLVAGLGALVQAAVAVMVTAGMTVWAASAIVGVVLGIVGVIVLMSGAAKMSPTELAPSRTVRDLEKDVTLVKETVR